VTDLLSTPGRIAVLVGACLVLLALEALNAPRAGRVRDRARRWRLNIAFGALGFGFGRATASLGPVMAGLFPVGLFHHLDAPIWAQWVIAFLVMDLAVYAQHRAMHECPLLWRLHRVHHTDPTLDVTTAYRFHPLELAVSFVWKGAVAMALGAPLEAVIAYELCLSLGSLFTHVDLRLPVWLDRTLRLVIATPALHERHHGPSPSDHNGNYGTVLTLWDRLFGTYKPPPPDGMTTLGWGGVEQAAAARLSTGLAEPFLQR
jgi:sterol desaturase/sphingolipid hydroxylase (fatty acid hydroxylase superfamily)